MSLFNTLISTAKDAAMNYLDPQQPDNATLHIYEEGLGKPATKLVCQFNPSEYTITRKTNTQQKNAAGQEAKTDDIQVTDKPSAVLSVTLYFDAYSDLEDLSPTKIVKNAMGAGGAAAGIATGLTEVLNGIQPKANGEVSDRCKEIATSLKFAADIHAPPPVALIWGKLHFAGTIINSVINYTMFNPDGSPVRMKVSLEISGEEADVEQQTASTPFQSPDRTKERLLQQGDQLWMLAAEEYGDPGKWKVIAKANDILNPRISRGAGVNLKVPSIQ